MQKTASHLKQYFRQLTLKRGERTADPAEPNSNAFNSCGNTLWIQNCLGKLSKLLSSDRKNSFCSA